MKRNKNLIELSRDHHHGLLLGWKIKQGFKRKVDLSEIADYIIHFANEALFSHFDEEENQVLIYLSKEDSFRKQVIAEHAEIKDLIKQISLNPLADTSAFLKLAEKLEAHIRFEERALFPHLENTLSEDQLEEIGSLITEVHKPYIETYANEFWAN